MKYALVMEKRPMDQGVSSGECHLEASREDR